MEKKKVTFNLDSVKCGMCMKSGAGEANHDSVSSFCQTCGFYLCTFCLKSHRRLVASDNHIVLKKDQIFKPEGTHKHGDKPKGIDDDMVPKSNLINEYQDYRNKVMSELNKKPHEFKNEINDSNGGYKSKGKTETKNAGVDAKNHTGDKSNGQPEHNNDDDDVQEQDVECTEYCTTHGDHFIKYFCEHHQELLCDVCKIHSHKACKKSVKYISELVADSDAIDTAIDEVEEEITDMKECDKKLQCDLKELKKSKDNFLFDLTSKKKEIQDWFNKMEVKAVRQADAVFERCKHDIKTKRNEAKEAKHELSAELYFLKAVQKSGSENKISKFVKAKRAEKGREMLTDIKDRRKFSDTRFSMTADHDFEATRKDITELYKLSFQNKGETKYNVRLPEDLFVSDITGCAIMPCGNYAFADRSNARVKVISPVMKPVAAIFIPDGVFDITTMGKSTLAVTSPNKAKIQVVDVQEEPDVTAEILTGRGQCWGVKYVKEGDNFVVNCSVNEEYYVRKVNRKSEILFEVKVWNSFYSELSIDEKTKTTAILLASAYGDYKLQEVEMNYVDEHKLNGGEMVVMQYNYLNHLHTTGVTSDRHGNLIVCCKDTHQIYTISRTGQEVELMLAEVDGVVAPQAVCYTHNKDKMLVTSENTDFIQIFEFDI